MPEMEASLKQSLTTEDENRSEPRYQSEDPAVITLLSSGDEYQAKVVDVSKTGIRVCVSTPIPVNRRLRFRFGRLIGYGEVRWCRPLQGARFEAGIHVDHTLARQLVDAIDEAANQANRAHLS